MTQAFVAIVRADEGLGHRGRFIGRQVRPRADGERGCIGGVDELLLDQQEAAEIDAYGHDGQQRHEKYREKQKRCTAPVPCQPAERRNTQASHKLPPSHALQSASLRPHTDRQRHGRVKHKRDRQSTQHE